jgi:hypothetical protein
MIKFKIIYSINNVTYDEYGRSTGNTLEHELNKFLCDKKIQFLSINQVASGRSDHHVTTTIAYNINDI